MIVLEDCHIIHVNSKIVYPAQYKLLTLGHLSKYTVFVHVMLSLDYLLSVSLDNFDGHLSKYTVFVHIMLSLDYLLSVSLDNFGGHLSKYTVFRLSFVRVLGQFWWTFVQIYSLCPCYAVFRLSFLRALGQFWWTFVQIYCL